VVVTATTHRGGRDACDSGFTLAELLVAVTLFIVALGVAYMALSALTMANDVATQEATFARSITYPIDQFQKFAMQNTSIAYADAYRFDFWADVHGDGTPDLYSFWTDSSGKFYKRVQRYTAVGGTAVGTAQTSVLSPDNANVARSVPLFTFYDTQGRSTQSTPSAGTTSTASTWADRVMITVVAKYRANYMQSSTDVTFRNRSW
jgi:prepilin-type N-terminal cleavage/methylation domain-containing protein